MTRKTLRLPTRGSEPSKTDEQLTRGPPLNGVDALPITPQTRAVDRLLQARWRFEAAHEFLPMADRPSRIRSCAIEVIHSEGAYRVVMNPEHPERWGCIQPCEYGK